MREFLEKNYKEDASTADTIKLAVKSLLEVVQTGAKNIDMAVMDGHGSVRVRGALRLQPLLDTAGSTDTPCFRLALDIANGRPARHAQNLSLKEIEDVVAEIEKEKEAEAEKKRNRLAATQASQAAMLQAAGGGSE